MFLFTALVLFACTIYLTVTYKYDHGFVTDEKGNDWRMYRMQTFGMTGDYFPVFRKE